MRRHRRSLNPVRRPIAAAGLRVSDAWPVIRMIILIACVSAGVLVMILFGFPLIEDLVKGVDPMERYRPKVEKSFSVSAAGEETSGGEIAPFEMYLGNLTTKNDPYIEENRIIFTTRVEREAVFMLDGVAVYDTQTQQAETLPDVEKKYDNLLSPVLSGNYAVWIDSMVEGGGRIVGYDLAARKQFLIKEYAYAIPQLSLTGEILTFMQWAGDTTQRLYAYNVRTREAVTVKLYETPVGNSASDVSETDLVWSEYTEDTAGLRTALKRIVFSPDGTFRYENYDMGMDVYEPKTNGRDVVFATAGDIVSGSLMLSSGGGEPVKLADNVLNYDLGENFVAYTKDDQVYVCYTDRQETLTLTKEITKNLLVCVNGGALTYYDITDGISTDEVVMYAYVE